MLSLFKRILHQPIRPFATTQPIAYLLKSDRLSQLAGYKPFSSLMYLVPWLRERFTQLDTNERIAELPFVFAQIGFGKSKKILDIGCCESTVSISLATLGHQVTGIDIRPYPLTHANFTFVQGDICSPPFARNQFDVVLSLSTLEHIGLDSLYGAAPAHSSDTAAVLQAYSLLKPGGKLILTVPSGSKAAANSFMRIYTPARLKQLLKKFTIETMQFLAPDAARSAWSICTANDLPRPPHFGVALIVAVKPKTTAAPTPLTPPSAKR